MDFRRALTARPELPLAVLGGAVGFALGGGVDATALGLLVGYFLGHSPRSASLALAGDVGQ